MDSRSFEAQMGRLRAQWPSFYGSDRTARIFSAYREATTELFTRIVDTAIDRMRAAPLLDDLNKLEHDVRRRMAEEKITGRSASFGSVLADAERKNKTADPDFVRACRKHLDAFLSGRISRAQFDSGCEEINHVAAQLEGRVPVTRLLSPQEKAAGTEKDDE